VTARSELAEVYDLKCCKCGKPGPDTVEDPGALAALMGPRMLTGQAQIMPPFGIRTVRAADVEACRPVHRTCPAPRRPAERPPYDILRSVA
jgi:hypothetical protein